MLETRFIGLVMAQLALAACSSATLPVLPAPGTASPKEQAQEQAQETAALPVEHTTIAEGSPTDVYALVARGARRCWLGPDGPLKATHVFHAETASPAEGGTAEMVLHERDETLRDKRGARAFHVVFTAESGGARVTASSPKMEAALGEVMAKDVAEWAKGGGGCHLPGHIPPALTPVVGDGSRAPGSRR